MQYGFCSSLICLHSCGKTRAVTAIRVKSLDFCQCNPMCFRFWDCSLCLPLLSQITAASRSDTLLRRTSHKPISSECAIATITEPDILIVDETFSVGDVFFQEKCERRIQHFIDDGHVTVLFVSHAMDQVERICQRAVWI